MLSDNDILVRQKAVATILELRINTEAHDNEDIRPFILPSLKRNPDTYVNMINWEETFVTEPPFTKSPWYLNKKHLGTSTDTCLAPKGASHAPR